MSDKVVVDTVALPHGAWFDKESGLVTFAIERMTLSFTVMEFVDLVEQLDDVAEILTQMVEVEGEECPECGTKFDFVNVTPPSDEDFN
jgi:hypothetical protein